MYPIAHPIDSASETSIRRRVLRFMFAATVYTSKRMMLAVRLVRGVLLEAFMEILAARRCSSSPSQTARRLGALRFM